MLKKQLIASHQAVVSAAHLFADGGLEQVLLLGLGLGLGLLLLLGGLLCGLRGARL